VGTFGKEKGLPEHNRAKLSGRETVKRERVRIERIKQKKKASQPTTEKSLKKGLEGPPEMGGLAPSKLKGGNSKTWGKGKGGVNEAGEQPRNQQSTT